jgi:hypothetical protein
VPNHAVASLAAIERAGKRPGVAAPDPQLLGEGANRVRIARVRHALLTVAAAVDALRLGRGQGIGMVQEAAAADAARLGGRRLYDVESRFAKNASPPASG